MDRVCSPERVIGLRPFLGTGNENVLVGNPASVFA